MYLKKADASQVMFAGMAAPASERTSPTPARKETVKISAKPVNNQLEKPKTKAGKRLDLVVRIEYYHIQL